MTRCIVDLNWNSALVTAVTVITSNFAIASSECFLAITTEL